MKPSFEGGCLCGKTRYRLTAQPTSLGDCHCMDCRRASAAPYVTWGKVPREALELTRGELRRVVHAERLRDFAACCGTPLFFRETAEAALVDFTVASLDDPAPFAPKKVLWTEDRLPWVTLDAKLPAYKQDSASG